MESVDVVVVTTWGQIKKLQKVLKCHTLIIKCRKVAPLGKK
jgi:hypothetical protein